MEIIDLRNKYQVECPRAVGSYLEEAPEGEIFDSGHWCLEQKMDGERVTLQLGPEGSLMVGRHRQDFLKGVDAAGAFRNMNSANPKIAAIACKKNLDLTLLDGELTESFTQNGQYTETTLKRIRVGEFIGYSSWGILFHKGKDVRGLSEEDRHKLAEEVIKQVHKQYPPSKDFLRVLERMPADRKVLQQYFDNGYEGMVAKNLKAGIPIDKRDNRNWWKLKADKTIDAFIIGVTESMSGGSGVKGIKRQPNGKAATFTIALMDGAKIIEVGKMSNLTDEMKENGLANFEKVYKHEVVEVRVSGWNGKEFRYPRFIKWRDDKRPKNCTFSEQIGGKK